MSQIHLFTIQDLSEQTKTHPIFKSEHKRALSQLEVIEPWQEVPENNPFISIKSEQINHSIKTHKKSISLSINPLPLHKSSFKDIHRRQSKLLPVMDVGQLNFTKKNIYSQKHKFNCKSTSRLDKIQNDTFELNWKKVMPTVMRQLSIERKIFRLKNLSMTNGSCLLKNKTNKIAGSLKR